MFDSIPGPSETLLEDYLPRFEPAPGLSAWIKSTFIEEGGSLYNRDHQHLTDAEIGVVFVNVERVKRQRVTLGMAQLGEPSRSDAWSGALHEWIRRAWFGDAPDFVMTLQAQRFAEMDAVSRCALIEHELYHMAQATDRFGSPMFTKDGRPKWSIRGHDVEEFVGVVRRYGAWSPGLEEMAGALERGPTLTRAKIEGACGTCGRELA